MALDYGTKRCGLAVTDPQQIIASPLTTVDTQDLIPYLKEYCQKEEVDLLVIGEPKRWSGEPSDVEFIIRKKLLPMLQKELPQLPLERADEMFTSKMAAQALYAGGLSKKKRQDKRLLDSTSAALILQEYLGHI